MNEHQRGMIGVEEMAAYFGRTPQTWRRWVRQGRAPLPDHAVDKSWYYRRSVLAHFEETGKWPASVKFQRRAAASRIARIAEDSDV